ncbi:MAG: TldD/PmbA family protein [Dictyoglomus thermophilum]
MWGEDKILSLLKDIINKIPFERKEVSLSINSQELTRFANNTIHQNVAEENLSLTMRVGEGKRKIIVNTSDIDKEKVDKLIQDLYDLLKAQPETEELYLPESEPIPEYEKNLIAPSPELRADLVKNFIEKAEKHNLDAFGALSENTTEFGIINSNGVEAYATYSYAHGKVMYMGEGSGYQEELGKNLVSINFEKLSERALQKCIDSRNPEEIDPGIYTVILEPLAVGELFEMLSYFGFSAKAVQEKRSFLNLYMGQKIFKEFINVFDDGLNPEGIVIPIDFEGVPKKRVDLIKNGVPIGPVYDTATAAKEGKKSTGHALPPPSWGPAPLNLFFTPGEKTLEEIISETEKGILVTRFHYVNAFLDPIKVLATGMTRDGTFLIENGKIKKPLKNLRFTQSFVEALANVVDISNEAILVPSMGFSKVPAIKVENFNFTGKTEF